MPKKIVDLSAVSEIIRDEPWHLHFWESTPDEFFDFLRDPRGELFRMGIELPDECRIETTIENHDWLTSMLSAAEDGPIIICGTGGGNIAKAYYKVSFYAHRESEVGAFEKTLLHRPDERERQGP
jgi:hypothetical protein